MKRSLRPIGILLAATLPASWEALAQPRAPLDSGRGRVILSAPGAIGGPRSVRGATGLRFPLIPAGSLASRHPLALVHRSAGKGTSARVSPAAGGRAAGSLGSSPIGLLTAAAREGALPVVSVSRLHRPRSAADAGQSSKLAGLGRLLKLSYSLDSLHRGNGERSAPASSPAPEAGTRQ